MSSAAPTSAATASRFGPTDAGLVAMAVIWGVNYSVMKAGLRDLSPLAFGGLRMTLAAGTLWLIVGSLRNIPWPSARDRRHLLLLGLLGNGAYQLCFTFGLSQTRAGVAALITAAGPAWIAIMARFLGRERITGRGWTGIVLQLLGAACVVASASAFTGSGNGLTGALLIAAGSLAWGLFSVLLQPYTMRAHPMALSALTMSSGATLLLLVAAADLRQLDWGGVTLAQWGSIAYAGLGSMVIAYLFFYRGVKVLGPTRTAMYGNLQPIIALSVAWMTLGERPTGWQLLGTASIVAGLLVSRTARPRPPRTDTAQ